MKATNIAFWWGMANIPIYINFSISGYGDLHLVLWGLISNAYVIKFGWVNKNNKEKAYGIYDHGFLILVAFILPLAISNFYLSMPHEKMFYTLSGILLTHDLVNKLTSVVFTPAFTMNSYTSNDMPDYGYLYLSFLLGVNISFLGNLYSLPKMIHSWSEVIADSQKNKVEMRRSTSSIKNTVIFSSLSIMLLYLLLAQCSPKSNLMLIGFIRDPAICWIKLLFCYMAVPTCFATCLSASIVNWKKILGEKV